MRATAILFVVGCGGATARAPIVARTPESSPPPVAVVAATPPPPAPPPVGCTDGGDFAGALVADNNARYCIDDACWSFDLATKALTPITKAAATAAAPGDIAIAYTDVATTPTNLAPSSHSSWTAKIAGSDPEVCNGDSCEAFTVFQPKREPDPDLDAVADIAISGSGERVAVVRGLEAAAKHMPVEIYDRASHKRLGVVTPTMRCSRFVGFAGESAIVQEWGCANQGGPRDIISAAGKLVAHVDGDFLNRDDFVHVEGDRWAFLDHEDGSIQIYDVVTGKRLGARPEGERVIVGVAAAKLYVFEDSGRLSVLDSVGHMTATVKPPTCRWEWEDETIGKLHVGMTGPELEKLLGKPRATKPDVDMKVIVSYPRGLSLLIQTFEEGDPKDPCGGGPQPSRVLAIDVKAPSVLATPRGIAIGSSLAELDRAYGSHRIAKRTTDGVQVFSNPEDNGGLTFQIADGKVTAIHVGDFADD